MGYVEQMPQCKNPQHPGDDRDTMILVDEKRLGSGVTHHVFACLRCRDINKVLSVQVRSTPEFRQYINSAPRMQQYKRARLVERDPTNGRIKYFR